MPSMLANPHDADLPPSTLPRRIQVLGVVALVVLLVVSVAYLVTEHWRRATVVFGVAMLWLAILRFTCDSKVLGILTVRSRRFDAIYSASLGMVMLFLALSVDSLGS